MFEGFVRVQVTRGARSFGIDYYTIIVASTSHERVRFEAMELGDRFHFMWFRWCVIKVSVASKCRAVIAIDECWFDYY